MHSIGRYQLLERLGQGGMGVVYRAHDTLLERTVAVKVISAPIDRNAELRERFFREARAAGQLSHKNIITIHDLGEHEGQPYLAMEYLEGHDLLARMASQPRLSLRRKIDIASEICEGLDYAHIHGVVHRDIKPGNIFVTNSGVVKILDFGLARLVTSELTRSNMMMGTLNYMAPEQIRGERVDHRSDIFSTGVVLYELLCGKRAFEGDSFASTLYKILQESPTPLREMDAMLPTEMVQVVERALEKAREDRYQHTSEMLADLSRCRERFGGVDSPAGGRTTPSALRPPSDVPTRADSASPWPAMEVRTPPPPPAPGPVSSTGMRLLPIALIATAILAVGAILAIWLAVRGSPAQPPSTPQTTSASAEPSIDDILQKALKAFEAEDYGTAERQAGDVLARDPGNDAAQRLRDRARTAAAAVDSGLKKARAFVAAGRHEEASRAAGEVLSVAPGNSEAKRIMEDGAAQSQGRGAQEARSQVARAKAAARSAGAQQLASPSYAAAITAERDAQRLSDSGRPGDATVKFYEASGLFRSAEVAAQNESAAREARARAAAEQAERTAKPEPPQTTTTSTPPPAALPSPPVKSEPVTIPSAPISPPVSSPAAPPPAVPAPLPPEKPAPGPEVVIGELLAQYKSALEARNLDALKRLWPGLNGAPQEAIRNEFGHASQITVEIVDPHIFVSGGTGTVNFLRRYTLITVEGRQLRSQSRTTMDVRRSGSVWVIERIRFEPVR
jgi:eukaryotic-like serine/threonine-protein kinase